MKNIFVGNLDPATNEQELRTLFQAYGAVETITLVEDRDTGAPRGFAFIEMPNDNEAEAAIQALNGALVGQQQITINEARSKHEGLNGKTEPERRIHPREPLPKRAHRRHRY
jgi:RNA recognition motif-containing protein